MCYKIVWVWCNGTYHVYCVTKLFRRWTIKMPNKLLFQSIKKMMFFKLSRNSSKV